jgi:GNAT superfamily N-acetyltransferase
LAIEVLTADSKRALKEFIEFPYSLYRNDPFWVPPLRIAMKELLDRTKHPFYVNAEVEFFLARREGRIVGRIAAILDRNYNKYHEENSGFFGFFESTNDPEVAKALLGTARKWVFDRGAVVLRGPVNPSTNYECGVLVEGFDSSPMIMMPYNPSYYPALMEGAGLHKGRDLNAFVSTEAAVELEKIGRVADRQLAKSGVTVRTINMKDFDGEVERLWDVYNSVLRRNWGFVPMTREEFVLMGKEMKQILKPEMVLVGEAGGKAIGFALALPDVNVALKPAGGDLFPTGLLKILYYQRLIKSLRVLALGVVDEYQASGVAAAFYATLVRAARKLGYNGNCEMSWIMEDNILMTRSLRAMGARHYKTYRIYEWQ